MWNDNEDPQEDEDDWSDIGGSEEDGNEDVAAVAEATEPPVEVDPEDPVQFPEQYYDVQMTYHVGDETIKAGTSVPIRCSNCAAWEAPLAARGGKSLCRPGKPFELPVKKGEDLRQWFMQEDRYSCQTHFIPQDMEDVLPMLTEDQDQIRILLWAFPVITKLVQLQNRIRKHCSKNDLDAEKYINTVVDFMLLFSSAQQQKLIKPFIKAVAKGLATRKKKKKLPRKKSSFRAGDQVVWEVWPGQSIEGYISSIGGRNKNVTIVVSPPHTELLAPGSTKPVRWQRPVAEWKKMKPQKLDSLPLLTGAQDD
ncbi:hypothetical protein LCGC14_0829570 [marine sediment metagenome]|uniref:Uncharacterized protein n=1 Tax=marine sediment metagenome TaxID=412755 RepID=A0A0F9Q1M3_9ZZZZ